MCLFWFTSSYIYIYLFIYICVYFFYNIHMKCQVKTHAPNNRWYLILLSLTFGDCSGLVKTLKHPKELHVCLRACWEFNLLGFSVPRWWASVILKFHTVSWCTRVPVISGCRWLVKPFTKHRKTEDPTWFIIYIYTHIHNTHIQYYSIIYHNVNDDTMWIYTFNIIYSIMNLLPFLVHNIWTNRTGQVPPQAAVSCGPVTVPAVCLMTCDERGAIPERSKQHGQFLTNHILWG